VLIHFDVTRNPSARWVIQQLREAFPSHRIPRCSLLDHVIVFDERHLGRLLDDYVSYYNAEPVHTRLGDSPEGRPTETRPSHAARVGALPRVGDLHHRYVWAEAA
jgi:hypothetical protein